jgi:predicted anti-sigma-YlaC factor YlaD
MMALSKLCQRARAWISLQADGELSELESSLLDSHLQGCLECQQFGRAAVALSAALRGSQLGRLPDGP